MLEKKPNLGSKMNSLYNQNNIKGEYWLNKTVSYIFWGKDVERGEKGADNE